MMKPFLAAMALALSASVAFAAEDSNITTKAMKDLPGNNGAGSTSNPTAKPNSGSLSEKQMQGQPGVNGDRTGSTATPNAKPEDGSLAGKEMEQNSGAQK
ncbi:MAG: hypothetical protein QM780_03180 [Hyphomicrobium sp.]|uniref:hypothetical protein n=1 Tax=Hyphomicrobium sp. TaxID=82 RepID=UPI0039E61216